MHRVVWAEESKTGLGFEIGPQQQKCQCSPNVHLMGNPDVPESEKHGVTMLTPSGGVVRRSTYIGVLVLSSSPDQVEE